MWLSSGQHPRGNPRKPCLPWHFTKATLAGILTSSPVKGSTRHSPPMWLPLRCADAPLPWPVRSMVVPRWWRPWSSSGGWRRPSKAWHGLAPLVIWLKVSIGRCGPRWVCGQMNSPRACKHKRRVHRACVSAMGSSATGLRTAPCMGNDRRRGSNGRRCARTARCPIGPMGASLGRVVKPYSRPLAPSVPLTQVATQHTRASAVAVCTGHGATAPRWLKAPPRPTRHSRQCPPPQQQPAPKPVSPPLHRFR